MTTVVSGSTRPGTIDERSGADMILRLQGRSAAWESREVSWETLDRYEIWRTISIPRTTDIAE